MSRSPSGSRERGNGIVTRRSRHGFDETVSRLTAMIETKGAKVFAVIDHAGEAARPD